MSPLSAKTILHVPVVCPRCLSVVSSPLSRCLLSPLSALSALMVQRSQGCRGFVVGGADQGLSCFDARCHGWDWERTVTVAHRLLVLMVLFCSGKPMRTMPCDPKPRDHAAKSWSAWSGPLLLVLGRLSLRCSVAELCMQCRPVGHGATLQRSCTWRPACVPWRAFLVHSWILGFLDSWDIQSIFSGQSKGKCHLVREGV
jgi:hypothetical protein